MARIVASLALVLVLLGSPVHAGAQATCDPPIPPAVAKEQNIFSEQQEIDLGDAVAAHVQRTFGVVDDEALNARLNEIGARLLRQLPPMRLPVRFVLVDVPDANAFTLPGGRIYVCRKLVALAQTEDELAGVMGHELGHVVAHHGAIVMTRLFREVLGVTSVGDRANVFETYDRMVENAARKPKAFEARSESEQEQLVADRIGLYTMTKAGYDPAAVATFFDRIAAADKGKGNFFTNLFGRTSPEAKRLREMAKGVATLPPSCIEQRAAGQADDFTKWKTAVVDFAAGTRKEALHSIRSKTMLEPPLRGDATNLRFSPDGAYVLAQDDAGIDVLTRAPLAPLFHIDAVDANAAQFTPDSLGVVFDTSDMRVEVWDIQAKSRRTAHELYQQTGAIQTSLSPDGKTLGFLDSNFDLYLFDVASGARLLQKKSFCRPDQIKLFLITILLQIGGDLSFEDLRLVNLGFSPDGRYFAAGTVANGETVGLVFDVQTKQQVKINGTMEQLLAGEFAFLDTGRIVGSNARDRKKSGIHTFPGGEVVEQFPLGTGKLAAVTRGNVLLIRPLNDYPVAAVDLATKGLVAANKLPAFDIFDTVFVSQLKNGEVAVYDIKTSTVVAHTALPRAPLGRLRASAVSGDLKWLAVSGRARGAVWDVTTGERKMLVRGFRGGHFGDGSSFFAEFPKEEKNARAVVKLDVASRVVGTPRELEDVATTYQFGPWILKTGRPNDSAPGVFDVSVASDGRKLWSRTFEKEMPRVWGDPTDGTLVLVWTLDTDHAKAQLSADAKLAARAGSKKEREGDYLLEVVDGTTGASRGRIVIETGKGSFRIKDLFAAGDAVVISDTQNRILVYSLATGEKKGSMFGDYAEASATAKTLSVENEPGKVTLYALDTLARRDELTFAKPVSFMRFAADGSSLLVLTKDQIAYVVELAPADPAAGNR